MNDSQRTPPKHARSMKVMIAEIIYVFSYVVSLFKYRRSFKLNYRKKAP